MNITTQQILTECKTINFSSAETLIIGIGIGIAGLILLCIFLWIFSLFTRNIGGP